MYNKKLILLLFLLIIAIGTVSTVSAISPTNDTISDYSDDKIEVIENNINTDENIENQILSNDQSDGVDKLNFDGDSLTELQTLIDNAQERSTISLDRDYYCSSDFEDTRGVQINKVLTINGNGHTINTFNNARAFTILADGVVINDLTFINGINCCLYLYNNLTTFNNCNFINNSGTYGGAIVTSGELRINNCYFYNNYAEKNGGAIYAYYPFNGKNSVKITNSIFDGNWAEQYGGAVYLNCYKANAILVSGAAKSFIKNTTFTFNEAVTGGALFNYQYTDIEDCEFMLNYAAGNGGAIYMSCGLIFEADNVGSASQTNGLEIHGNTTFIENYAENEGGAIRISAIEEYVEKGIKGILYVYDNVTFEGNYALNGGALSLVDSECAVNNAVFRDNEAYYDGSAMYGGTAINCIFEGNTEPVTCNTEIIDSLKAKLSLTQSGSYYDDKILTVKLTNEITNAGIANKIVVLTINGKNVELKTDSNGKATYNVKLQAGRYTAKASVADKNIDVNTVTLTNVEIQKTPITISSTKLTTTYKSGKYFQVKVTNSKTKKLVSGAKLNIKIFVTSTKYYNYNGNTNSNGQLKLLIDLKPGTYKVVVSNALTKYYNGAQKTSSIKISKASYKISAPKATNVYKQSQTFKITVKNKASGKVVSNVKLTVKVYTGSKYKTYNIKTNSKGIATINTKALSKGTHKIVIDSKATDKYKSAKYTSSVSIANKIKTSINYEPGLIFHATQQWVNQYTFHTHTYSVTIKVILTDNNGKSLTKPVTLVHSDGYTAKGTSGESITVSGGRPGTVTLKFAGDSKYMASSYVVNLGNEPT